MTYHFVVFFCPFKTCRTHTLSFLYIISSLKHTLLKDITQSSITKRNLLKLQSKIQTRLQLRDPELRDTFQKIKNGHY